MMGSANKPRLAAALALVFMVLATACAHVGRADFEEEIAALRAELDGQDNGMDGRSAAQIAALSARLDRLTQGLSNLEDEFDVTIERLEAAIRFDIPVYFAFDRDELRPQDLPVLARFGDVVSEYYPDVCSPSRASRTVRGPPSTTSILGSGARRPSASTWSRPPDSGGSRAGRQLRRRSRSPRLPRSGRTEQGDRKPAGRDRHRAHRHDDGFFDGRRRKPVATS